MRIELKEVCESLIKVTELCEKSSYEKFPLDYLNEITKKANELVNPSEETLINQLKN